MRIHVISYFSPNYAPYAGKLAESLRRWGVPDQDVTIQPVPQFRSWHHGVSWKPKFIRDALERFSYCDGLLWLDADAYAVRHVPWSDLQGADVAAAKFQWSPGHKLEILTGTMFFAVNNRVAVMVDQWIHDTTKFSHSDTPEQDALFPLIQSWKQTVHFEPLSVEWAYIDDPKVKEQYPSAIPIFKHTQASRHIRAEEFKASRR